MSPYISHRSYFDASSPTYQILCSCPTNYFIRSFPKVASPGYKSIKPDFTRNSEKKAIIPYVRHACTQLPVYDDNIVNRSSSANSLRVIKFTLSKHANIYQKESKTHYENWWTRPARCTKATE